MARFRLALPAQADITNILAVSAARWGAPGQRRYRSLLATAMRLVANEPKGPLTQSRNDLLPGLRTFHIQHARGHDPQNKVGRPVHRIYFRSIQPGWIEIIRVLHERMEPRQQFEMDAEEAKE
jgi:toxin ParE1/3/4